MKRNVVKKTLLCGATMVVALGLGLSSGHVLAQNVSELEDAHLTELPDGTTLKKREVEGPLMVRVGDTAVYRVKETYSNGKTSYVNWERFTYEDSKDKHFRDVYLDYKGADLQTYEKANLVKITFQEVGQRFLTFYGDDGKITEPILINVIEAEKPLVTQPTADRFPVLRLYDPKTGVHFYTGSTLDSLQLKQEGWLIEGTGWDSPLEGNMVYRVFNPNSLEHHFTMDVTEREHLLRLGWADEGGVWWSDPKQGVPVYRAYNPNVKVGSHNYTTSKTEQAALIKAGWKDEGIAWYGIQ